jgi:hypothetical protein
LLGLPLAVQPSRLAIQGLGIRKGAEGLSPLVGERTPCS